MKSSLLLVLVCGVIATMGAMPSSSPVGEIRHLIPEVSKPEFIVANADAIASAEVNTISTASVPVGWSHFEGQAFPTAYPCTYADASPSTKKWDLSPLTKTSGDYGGTENPSEYLYHMNVCADLDICKAPKTGAISSICQFEKDATTWVASLGTMGLPPPAVWGALAAPDDGVTFTFTNGDQCWIEGRQMIRTVVQVFKCQADKTDTSFTVSEDKIQCIFTVLLNTNIACQGDHPKPPDPTPTNPTTSSSGMSGGTVFLIIVFSVLPLYIGLGLVYGYKKKGVTGMDAFPNVEFWRDLPALVRDGARYSWNMTRSGCKNGRAEQYDAL